MNDITHAHTYPRTVVPVGAAEGVKVAGGLGHLHRLALEPHGPQRQPALPRHGQRPDGVPEHGGVLCFGMVGGLVLGLSGVCAAVMVCCVQTLQNTPPPKKNSKTPTHPVRREGGGVPQQRQGGQLVRQDAGADG